MKNYASSSTHGEIARRESGMLFNTIGVIGNTPRVFKISFGVISQAESQDSVPIRVQIYEELLKVIRF